MFMSLLSLVQNSLLFLVCLPWAIVVPIWVFISLFKVLLPRAFRKFIAYKEGRDTPGARLEKGVWTIHGRRYDLTPFLEKHPGGSWALQLGRNRDCTGLFESYHVFADMSKLEKIMAVYELPESKAQTINVKPTDNPTGLEFRDPFHEDVKQMTRDFFKQKGYSHKMKPWVVVCVIIVILAEIFCAGLLLKGYRVALVLMPILGWLLTGNVSHEASHFALSSRPLVNQLFACTSAPLYYNSTAWYIQHIIQHHVYTNDESDVDLYHFLPIARMSRCSKYCPQFKMQWFSCFFGFPTAVCHILFVVPLDLLTGYTDPVTNTRRYEQCENVDDLVAAARGRIIFEFAFSLLFPVLIFISHGFFKGFYFCAIMYTFCSAFFIVFTQGAHLQEQCMKGHQDSSWAKHQVSTSLNFKPTSMFWSFASGGLNVQALHHLLPTVSASHLCEMYPMFVEVCKKHDVEVKEASGIVNFVGGFYAWVSQLSEETPVLDKAKTG